MTQSATITFRGQEYEVDYETEGSTFDSTGEDPLIIFWSFHDLTQDQVDALKITDEENEAIDKQLYEHYVEGASDYGDYE